MDYLSHEHVSFILSHGSLHRSAIDIEEPERGQIGEEQGRGIAEAFQRKGIVEAVIHFLEDILTVENARCRADLDGLGYVHACGEVGSQITAEADPIDRPGSVLLRAV